MQIKVFGLLNYKNKHLLSLLDTGSTDFEAHCWGLSAEQP